MCKQHGKHNAEAASDFVPNFNFSSSSEARRALGFLKLMLMLHDKFKIPEMQWPSEKDKLLPTPAFFFAPVSRQVGLKHRLPRMLPTFAEVLQLLQLALR